jgi:hypothetical protein
VLIEIVGSALGVLIFLIIALGFLAVFVAGVGWCSPSFSTSSLAGAGNARRPKA